VLQGRIKEGMMPDSKIAGDPSQTHPALQPCRCSKRGDDAIFHLGNRLARQVSRQQIIAHTVREP
jgi:hypothetical protein